MINTSRRVIVNFNALFWLFWCIVKAQCQLLNVNNQVEGEFYNERNGQQIYSKSVSVRDKPLNLITYTLGNA